MSNDKNGGHPHWNIKFKKEMVKVFQKERTILITNLQVATLLCWQSAASTNIPKEIRTNNDSNEYQVCPPSLPANVSMSYKMLLPSDEEGLWWIASPSLIVPAHRNANIMWFPMTNASQTIMTIFLNTNEAPSLPCNHELEVLSSHFTASPSIIFRTNGLQKHIFT